MKTREERFWEKVDKRKKNECWPWLASPMRSGHGWFFWGGDGIRGTTAIRAMWKMTYGVWPTEDIDHLCSNPPCVNPRHLEEVSHAENCRRTSERGKHGNQLKTECPKGHPYTPENTRYGTRGNGKQFRVCKACETAYTHTKRGPEKDRHTGPRRVYPVLNP